MDEFNMRNLLSLDVLEAIERGVEKIHDNKMRTVPSFNWGGSGLSLSFLSSNASSSSDLGSGAVDMLHPVGGMMYRSLKCMILRGVVEGRAGIANFVRLIRAAFIASHLVDMGETELKLPARSDKKASDKAGGDQATHLQSSPFVVCVNEIVKSKGLTHTVFTQALRNLAGRIKEAHLLGALVDVEESAEDPRTKGPLTRPEGFPNSYVRGASIPYCRVGIHIEAAKDAGANGVSKGIQLQMYAEPVIPEGGIAYGGPITVRVVENEGQFREFVKELTPDGSRRDWGTTLLHAKPVTTLKAQTTAGGSIETGKESGEMKRAFNRDNFHTGGYQAIELVRLLNLTPLLWIRVDPMGLFGGKVAVFQPDACLAEQLFHDGDSAAQIDAIRSLAERPTPIQATFKISTVHDAKVQELPVRVLGDCLRGSPALHSSLSHTPAVRAQAAYAIAQWQNNKAPETKDSIGDAWVGMNLLFQYFRERFMNKAAILPVKFTRLAVKSNETKSRQQQASGDGSNPSSKAIDDTYVYLDALEEGEERATAMMEADEVELEEDEEYRVRAAVVTAIASVRAKDGLTPPVVVSFLVSLLESEDAEIVGHLVFPEDELAAEKAFEKVKHEKRPGIPSDFVLSPSLSYVSSSLVAEALLALCQVNARKTFVVDPITGKKVPTSAEHPLNKLIKAARGWLNWENYRERQRIESTQDEILLGHCQGIIGPCATLALCSLAIQKQVTTDAASLPENGEKEDAVTSKFYYDLFYSSPTLNDLTRAACAQAFVCVCCASDRLEIPDTMPTGLLTALEFLLEAVCGRSISLTTTSFLLTRFTDPLSSRSLRHTLALLMMDACTGKVASSFRVGSAIRNDLVVASYRYFSGPLGASHGSDNGSAVHTAVKAATMPVAAAVNDGARRGLRLLTKLGKLEQGKAVTMKPGAMIIRVATFASRLWRVINGDEADSQCDEGLRHFAYDGELRVSLLSLYQRLWETTCPAVDYFQKWVRKEGLTADLKELGSQNVMRTSSEENVAAAKEGSSLAGLKSLVQKEIDRQEWRCKMVSKAYERSRFQTSAKIDVAAKEQGIGEPLPPIERDAAFKQGGWISSAAQQRRDRHLDGGTAVTKIRVGFNKAKKPNDV